MPIDPDAYELHDRRCLTRDATAWVDGAMVAVDQYVSRVTVVNRLEESSRSYQAIWTYTYSDGSTSHSERTVVPLGPGESVEVGGLAGHSEIRPSPPVSCEIRLEDSIFNHVGS